MNYFLISLLFVFAATTPIQSIASSSNYQCEVITDAYIKGSGNLDLLRDSQRIGQRFTVVKTTGQIAGDIIDGLSNPKVVALGSEKNVYKVIWQQKAAGKDGAFVDYLSIDESVKGKLKPFGFFSGGSIFTGICE